MSFTRKHASLSGPKSKILVKLKLEADWMDEFRLFLDLIGRRALGALLIEKIGIWSGLRSGLHIPNLI